MSEQRRDGRIDVALPYLLTNQDGTHICRCTTVDISPTSILLEVKEGKAPRPDTIVNVAVQGSAEAGWEHINTHPMKVIRVDKKQVALIYVEVLSPEPTS